MMTPSRPPQGDVTADSRRELKYEYGPYIVAEFGVLSNAESHELIPRVGSALVPEQTGETSTIDEQANQRHDITARYCLRPKPHQPRDDQRRPSDARQRQPQEPTRPGPRTLLQQVPAPAYMPFAGSSVSHDYALSFLRRPGTTHRLHRRRATFLELIQNWTGTCVANNRLAP